MNRSMLVEALSKLAPSLKVVIADRPEGLAGFSYLADRAEYNGLINALVLHPGATARNAMRVSHLLEFLSMVETVNPHVVVASSNHHSPLGDNIDADVTVGKLERTKAGLQFHLEEYYELQDGEEFIPNAVCLWPSLSL